MTDCIAPDVFRSSRTRARKPHRCCECQRERILPGDRYLHISGLWDGEWQNYAMCGRCERARDALLREMDDDVAITELRMELRERIYNRHRWAKTWAVSS